MKNAHRLLVLALLLTAPAFGQEESNKKKAEPYRAVLVDAVATDPAERYWKVEVKNPHKDVGKCANCHVNAVLNDTTPHAALQYFLNDYPQSHAVALTLTQPDATTRSILKLPKRSGLIVGGVCPSTKGDVCGLKTHDIILQVNEKSVSDSEQVKQAIASDHALTFTILRQGVEKELKRPKRESAKTSDEKHFRIGVSLGELDPVVQSQLKLDESARVYIKQVTQDGAAAEGGLEPNDIVLSINEKSVDDANAVGDLVQKSKGKPLVIRLYRGGKAWELKITPRVTNDAATHTWLARAGNEYVQRLTTDAMLKPMISGALHPHWQAPVGTEKAEIEKRLSKIEEKLDKLLQLLHKEE